MEEGYDAYDQTKQLLARSIVRILYQNNGVKWDSSLINWDKKPTAQHAGDIKPKEATQLDSGEILESESEDDKTPGPKPPETKTKDGLTILKPTYTNPGMDTKSLVVPRTPMTTRSKGKLMLGNNAIPLDDTIETFVRSRKKAYKEVKYKDNY